MRKSIKRITGIAMGLLMCFVLSACQTGPAKEPATEAATGTAADRQEEYEARFLKEAGLVNIAEDTVTFTDASSRGELTLDKYPEKVVNLYASLTTLWYEAGGTAAGCIGGASAKELYEEYIGRNVAEDDGMTVISDSSVAKKWDIEQIIAMQPDLIICSTAKGGYETISGPAEAAGIPVIAVDYDDFSDYLKWFRVFCALNGREDLWESVAMKTYEEVSGVLDEIPDEGALSVFCMYAGTETLQADTQETMVGGMIADLGGVNIVESGKGEDRITINLETVYASDPDVILVEGHDSEDISVMIEAQYGNNPVWKSLDAVSEGRLYYLEKELFHNKPNRRFAEAYRSLAQILYPDCEFTLPEE